MVSSALFRRLALGLPGTSEAPHFDRAAFKVARIYATLAFDRATVNIKLTRDEQALECAARPEVFQPVAGGWGRLGWTTVDLTAINQDDLTRVLELAWQGALLYDHARAAAGVADDKPRRPIRQPGGGREPARKPVAKPASKPGRTRARKQAAAERAVSPSEPTAEAPPRPRPGAYAIPRHSPKTAIGTRKSDGAPDKSGMQRAKVVKSSGNRGKTGDAGEAGVKRGATRDKTRR